MSHQGSTFTEFQKFRQDHINGRSIFYHFITDTGQIFDFKADGLLGIDKYRIPIHHHAFLYFYSTNFNNLMYMIIQASGLQVEYDKSILQGKITGIFHDGYQIIYQITFHAVDQLQRLSLLQPVIGFRKCLYVSMIGQGQRRHFPVIDRFHQFIHIRNCIQLTKFGVTMEFHTLFRAFVHSFYHIRCRCFFNAPHRGNGYFLIKAIQGSYTFYADINTLGNPLF